MPKMVVFYRLKVDGPGREAAGRVRLVNGEIVITPFGLDWWLRQQTEMYGHRLDPADGQAYLDLLPHVFFSTYFWAAEEEEEEEEEEP